MQTIINNGVEGEFKTININIKFRAWLAHDNKYFDRTCSNPQCKGMYSSLEHAVCPKCNGQLTFITAKDGRPMAVSEGTFYPVLTQKQKERDQVRALAKKGGVEKVYRFKMYSFGDNNMVVPPMEHAFCKKGAMVEIHMVNHQADSAIFMTKQQVPKVEETYHIYDNYGDSVTLLEGPKVQETTTAYPVDAGGNPTPVNVELNNADGTPNVGAMMQVLQNLTTQVKAMEAGGVKEQAVNNAQNFNNQASTAVKSEFDPFDGAM